VQQFSPFLMHLDAIFFRPTSFFPFPPFPYRRLQGSFSLFFEWRVFRARSLLGDSPFFPSFPLVAFFLPDRPSRSIHSPHSPSPPVAESVGSNCPSPPPSYFKERRRVRPVHRMRPRAKGLSPFPSPFPPSDARRRSGIFRLS